MKVFILDKRSPGGDDMDLKNDYNLKVVNRTDEGFEVVGTKEDINSFVEDYAIPWLLLDIINDEIASESLLGIQGNTK